MKALVFCGPRNVKYEEYPKLEIRPGNVIINVNSCGICGTDLHIYKGLPSNWPVPGVRGHEISGIIKEIAEDVRRFKVGDRVVVQPLMFCGSCRACNNGTPNLCYNAILVGGEIPGGFAEQVMVPEKAIFSIPEGVSLREAACVEPLATPVHAFRNNVSGINETAVIFGAGPQGLLTLQIAKVMGVSKVYVFDVIDHRLEVAKRLGADIVFNSNNVDPVDVIKKETKGFGVDLAFDAAGIPSARQRLIQSLRRGGLGIFIALGSALTPIDFMTVGPGELRLCGTQCYTNSDFQIAINLILSKQITLEPMVSTYQMNEGAMVFEKLVTNPQEDIKVLLTVNP